MTNPSKSATIAGTALHGPCGECGEHAYRVRLDGPISHSDTGEAECEPGQPTTTVTLTVSIPTALLAEEFDDTPSELADAICGRLIEIDTNTGGVVVPSVTVLS